ncbi:MAG: transglutaminase-like domain-containing protein [Candidatus Cloacimonetes bacterium]|nr:transglutaminase-like domain-containing protein [Candidatus Cloacimonadota bacterium]
MKKFLFFLIIIALCFSLQALDLKERIKHYSGKNSTGLLNLLENTAPDTLTYLEFLLDNCSASDLAVLDADYLLDNVRYALKARELPYTRDYDDDIFRHFVLPHRMSQEPLEDWRPLYYKTLKPLVENCEDIAEAAILVNIWCLEEMSYKPTHGRDQSAFTSSKRGYGRCEEMMIIYMCAARAVGIPVRSCSAPYWNFTDSNHAWIEVWTPSGWKYLGEPASQLSKTWFTGTTQRATLITAKAFGNYRHPNAIIYEDSVTTLSSIEYYTDSFLCNIHVMDETGAPVPKAIVMPYAVSFGGIWPLTEMKTDADGNCRIPLGKCSTLIIAGKDSLVAWQMLTNLDGEERDLKLILSDNREISGDFNFLFPLPGSNPRDNEEPVFLPETFDLLRENADLKRKNRLNNQKFTADFARYYDLINSADEQNDVYFEQRKEFLDKADQLAANADDFLHVLAKTDDSGKWILGEMITTWDIKDLCEIPDSLALEDIVDIYGENRERFAASDSLFSEGCIARTWNSASPVQNGWQKEFYQQISPLLTDSAQSTVAALTEWVKDNTEIEDDFVWTYYSGALNPLEILNLHYVPAFYRTKVINSALKLAGIPVRWEGQLEFHNGSEWTAVNISTEQEQESELRNFTLRIFVDDQEVKADPYANFLVSALGEDGYLYNTWFDGDNDSLAFQGKYRLAENENIHIEAAIRNGNGDAAVAIRPLTSDDQEIIINLKTPKEFLDISTSWDADVLADITAFIDSEPFEGKKIVMVLAEKDSEPQVHSTRFLAEKLEKYSELHARLYIYSEKRSIKDLEADTRLQNAIIKKGKPILESALSAENYPAIFVFNENNELLFSAVGYNMGIADLIQKKLK